MPPLLDPFRRRNLAIVVVLLLIQGSAAAMAAFATRTLFVAIHAGAGLPLSSLMQLAVSGAVIAVTRVLSSTRSEASGQSYALEIRQALFSSSAAMPMRLLDQRRVGYMSLRFVGDLTALRNWPGKGLGSLLSALVLLPATFCVLWVLHSLFLHYVAPILGLGICAILLGGIALPGRHATLRKKRAAIAADMAERMPIAPALSALGRRDKELRHIRSKSRGMIDAAIKCTRLTETLRAIPDITAAVSAATLIWVGVQSNASTATIAAALSALALAINPMRNLATVWNDYAAFRVAHYKCKMALDRPQRPTIGKGKSLSPGPISVSAQNLAAPPLRELTFSVAAGSRAYLDGPSGSGRSLLLRILAGIDTSESGLVELNQHRIGSLSQGCLRRSVGLISLHTPFLRGTLRRTMSLGIAPRPSDEMIMQAAEKFGLNHLVEEVGGLDARIDEGGRNLSEGHRILIASLRVYLNQPKLILVDVTPGQLDQTGRKSLMTWFDEANATIISKDPDWLPPDSEVIPLKAR